MLNTNEKALSISNSTKLNLTLNRSVTRQNQTQIKIFPKQPISKIVYISHFLIFLYQIFFKKAHILINSSLNNLVNVVSMWIEIKDVNEYSWRR